MTVEEAYRRVMEEGVDFNNYSDCYIIATQLFPQLYRKCLELERQKADRDERAMERDERC